MAAESKSPVADVMERARGMMAVTPAMGPQLERFWKAQDDLLEQTEAFSRSWFERRHEATHAALDAVRRMNGNGADPSAAMKAVTDWQQGSFRRLAEEVQEWAELCSNCAARITAAEVAAGRDGAEELAKRAKPAARTKQTDSG